MANPQSAVLCDTNVYRNLVHGRSDAEVDERILSIAQAELRLEIQPFASPWVLIELAAHLADRTDPGYDACRLAMRAVWRHCAIEHPTNAKPALALAQDSEELLAFGLFGRRIEGHSTIGNALADCCEAVHDAEAGEELESWNPFFERMAAHVTQRERQFVDHLFAFLARKLNPEAEDWTPLSDQPEARARVGTFADSPGAKTALAEAIAEKAAWLAGLPSDAVTKEHIELALNWFPIAICHFSDILKRIASTGADFTKQKRANTLWDHQFALQIGPHHRLAGAPVRLVTGDCELLRIASEARHSELVISPTDYFTMLKKRTS